MPRPRRLALAWCWSEHRIDWFWLNMALLQMLVWMGKSMNIILETWDRFHCHVWLPEIGEYITDLKAIWALLSYKKLSWCWALRSKQQEPDRGTSRIGFRKLLKMLKESPMIGWVNTCFPMLSCDLFLWQPSQWRIGVVARSIRYGTVLLAAAAGVSHCRESLRVEEFQLEDWWCFNLILSGQMIT